MHRTTLDQLSATVGAVRQLPGAEPDTVLRGVQRALLQSATAPDSAWAQSALSKVLSLTGDTEIPLPDLSLLETVGGDLTEARAADVGAVLLTAAMLMAHLRAHPMPAVRATVAVMPEALALIGQRLYSGTGPSRAWEPPTASDLQPCPGCQVAPGQAHTEYCDHALCPDCGEQLELEGYCAPDGDTLPMWHGISPLAEVARRLSWWTTASGIDHPVEDTSRAHTAHARGQITWDPGTQRYCLGAELAALTAAEH